MYVHVGDNFCQKYYVIISCMLYILKRIGHMKKKKRYMYKLHKVPTSCVFNTIFQSNLQYVMYVMYLTKDSLHFIQFFAIMPFWLWGENSKMCITLLVTWLQLGSFLPPSAKWGYHQFSLSRDFLITLRMLGRLYWKWARSSMKGYEPQSFSLDAAQMFRRLTGCTFFSFPSKFLTSLKLLFSFF